VCVPLHFNHFIAKKMAEINVLHLPTQNRPLKEYMKHEILEYHQMKPQGNREKLELYRKLQKKTKKEICREQLIKEY
jgi:hypothetical protein